MLRERGYRLAMYNNFRVNPPVNPESYSYFVDVLPEHFMRASGRAVNLLRSLLHTSFQKARVTYQTEGGHPEDPFKENLHMTAPSEKKGHHPYKWTGCVPPAPLKTRSILLDCSRPIGGTWTRSGSSWKILGMVL